MEIATVCSITPKVKTPVLNIMAHRRPIVSASGADRRAPKNVPADRIDTISDCWDAFTFKANDGMADSNIGTVTLVVTTTLPNWAWMKGANTANQKGVYAGAVAPGARQDAAGWSDAAGNFWLFGGLGYGETTGLGTLNDLWKHDPVTGAWLWLKGSNAINATSIYGTQGVADAANTPGARSGAADRQ